jgi:hypothetical protein
MEAISVRRRRGAAGKHEDLELGRRIETCHSLEARGQVRRTDGGYDKCDSHRRSILVRGQRSFIDISIARGADTATMAAWD